MEASLSSCVFTAWVMCSAGTGSHGLPDEKPAFGSNDDHAHARQLLALVCSLRGSVCLYQGEELGLPEADVPYEALQDPYGKNFWPTFKGRDGCRTPMPWGAGEHAGFSAGQPWLPVPEVHMARNVEAQMADPASVLNAARAFLRWRKEQPALVEGAIRFLDAPAQILALVREHQGQRMLVAFNLSPDAVAWTPPAGLGLLSAPGVESASLRDGVLHFPARGAAFATLE